MIVDIVRHREEIIALWHECFGDEHEYIEFFLDCCPNKICFGSFNEDKLVSMLFLLNGSVRNLSCKYIYAACTAKKCRNRGIMGQLITSAKEYCTEQNIDALFLVPGEESLYSYYSKFGFIAGAKKTVMKISGKSYGFTVEKCDDISFIAGKRLELLSDLDCYAFDRETTEYSVKEFLKTGGEIYCSDGEDEFLAFVVKNDNIVTVKEILVKKTDIFPKICGIFEKLGAENVYIYAPVVYNKKDNGCLCTKCGMYYPISKVANTLKENDEFYAGMYLD